MEREGSHSYIAFARAGQRYLYVKSETVGTIVRYAEKKVEVGKREEKIRSRVLPATDLTTSYAKNCTVIKERAGMNGMSKARQRAQGQMERQQSSMSDGKSVE